jgi:hypothetical protein
LSTEATSPCTEAMLTMRPQLRAFIAGSAACVARNTADRLIAMMASQRSAGKLDRRGVLDAGVVDQDVDAAQAVHRGLHHGVDLLGLGHVGAVVADLDAELLCQPGTQRLDLRGVAEAVEHQVGAGTAERACDTQADAAGRAGDDGSLAFQHLDSPVRVAGRLRGAHAGQS